MVVMGPLVVVHLVPTEPVPIPLPQILIQLPGFGTRLYTHISVTSSVAVVASGGLGLPALPQRGALTSDSIGDIGSGMVMVDNLIRVIRHWSKVTTTLINHGLGTPDIL